MDRVCLECGVKLGEPAKTGGRVANFCGVPHRRAWHNRRMIRGALLYDAYMAGRYDRKTNGAVQTTMAQMGSIFRRRDRKERGGRRSWLRDVDHSAAAAEVD